MVIVAGHITIDPEQREARLADFMRVVEKARQADGCLDFAMSADLLDPGRVNLFERWESQEALEDVPPQGPQSQATRGHARRVGRRVRRRRPQPERYGRITLARRRTASSYSPADRWLNDSRSSPWPSSPA